MLLNQSLAHLILYVRHPFPVHQDRETLCRPHVVSEKAEVMPGLVYKMATKGSTMSQKFCELRRELRGRKKLYGAFQV